MIFLKKIIKKILKNVIKDRIKNHKNNLNNYQIKLNSNNSKYRMLYMTKKKNYKKNNIKKVKLKKNKKIFFAKILKIQNNLLINLVYFLFKIILLNIFQLLMTLKNLVLDFMESLILIMRIINSV